MKKLLLFLLLTTCFSQAQIINFPDANFKTALLSATTTNFVGMNAIGESVVIDTDGDLEISVLEAQAITRLLVFNASIVSLAGVENFVNLTSLSCMSNQITALDISALPNLVSLHCQNNLLTTLDATGHDQLVSIDCADNLLTSINITGLPELYLLKCINNQLTTIDFTGVPLMRILDADNNLISNINLSGLSALETVDLSFNQISTLDFTGCTALTVVSANNNLLTNLTLANCPLLSALGCNQNQITSLDLSGLPELTLLNCNTNLLTTIDCSQNHNLTNLDFGNNNIVTAFLKNGSDEGLTFSDFVGNDELVYVCADDFQIANALPSVPPSVVINSYCSFVPGGDYNSIEGSVLLDTNNDGCTISDVVPTFLRVNLSDGSTNGAAFVNNSGDYQFFVGAGNFTINPAFQNPSYFNSSPGSALINFPVADNSVAQQDFCITSNGVHPDLAITVCGQGARAGFDSAYQIVYTNNGNTTISGAVTLAFDDNLMDFAVAVPGVDVTAVGLLTWNYSNLVPFETRVVDVVFNINSPTDTPPVNADDVLQFLATIALPPGEETVADNNFQYNQTVVNSFDPNQITCLQGEIVNPDLIGDYLHYNVDFENIGTADAINIVVKSLIDLTKFDISTLQPIYTSHPVDIKIDDNKLEFIFENINLPSSINNSIGGHGNVLFKIKTLPTLPVGTMVSNMANIYFDYNFPIETNEARTTFTLLSTKDFTADASINVYPNPARNQVNIEAKSNIKSVQVFDIQGRILQTALENKNTTTLDIASHPKGIYFLKITTETGSKVEKLVKE